MAMEMITEFIRQHPVVVVGCVICGVIIFTKIRNYGKKKVQEIMLFSEKYLRPRAPLVIDQKDRNAVLKQSKSWFIYYLQQNYDVLYS